LSRPLQLLHPSGSGLPDEGETSLALTADSVVGTMWLFRPIASVAKLRQVARLGELPGATCRNV